MSLIHPFENGSLPELTEPWSHWQEWKWQIQHFKRWRHLWLWMVPFVPTLVSTYGCGALALSLTLLSHMFFCFGTQEHTASFIPYEGTSWFTLYVYVCICFFGIPLYTYHMQTLQFWHRLCLCEVCRLGWTTFAGCCCLDFTYTVDALNRLMLHFSVLRWYPFPKVCAMVRNLAMQFTKGSLGYLSSMYLSTSLVLGEVVDPFLEIDGWNSPHPSIPPWSGFSHVYCWLRC